MTVVDAGRKAWVVTTLTVRYLLSSRRGIATLALSWVPLLLVGSLALAKVASFDILLFQSLMVPIFLQVVLIFVTLVNGTALVREEIEDNTLPYLLTRPLSKVTVAASKYAGYLVAVLVLLVPPIVLAYGVTEAYAGSGLGTDLDVLEGFLAVTVLGAAAYGAFFLLLSVVLRRPLTVGLLFGFLWENIVVNLPGSVPKLSVVFYLNSILKGMISVGPLTGFRSDVPASWAAVILLVFTVVLLVLAAVAFQGMVFRQKA